MLASQIAWYSLVSGAPGATRPAFSDPIGPDRCFGSTGLSNSDIWIRRAPAPTSSELSAARCLRANCGQAWPSSLGFEDSRIRRYRLSIAELDLLGHPGAAGHATSQRRDPQLDLVTGPERGPRPAFPREGARAYAFEGPDLGGSVLLLDL